MRKYIGIQVCTLKKGWMVEKWKSGNIFSRLSGFKTF